MGNRTRTRIGSRWFDASYREHFTSNGVRKARFASKREAETGMAAHQYAYRCTWPGCNGWHRASV